MQIFYGDTVGAWSLLNQIKEPEVLTSKTFTLDPYEKKRKFLIQTCITDLNCVMKLSYGPLFRLFVGAFGKLKSFWEEAARATYKYIVTLLMSLDIVHVTRTARLIEKVTR